MTVYYDYSYTSYGRLNAYSTHIWNPDKNTLQKAVIVAYTIMQAQQFWKEKFGPRADTLRKSNIYGVPKVLGALIYYKPTEANKRELPTNLIVMRGPK